MIHCQDYTIKLQIMYCFNQHPIPFHFISNRQLFILREFLNYKPNQHVQLNHSVIDFKIFLFIVAALFFAYITCTLSVGFVYLQSLVSTLLAATFLRHLTTNLQSAMKQNKLNTVQKIKTKINKAEKWLEDETEMKEKMNKMCIYSAILDVLSYSFIYTIY